VRFVLKTVVCCSLLANAIFGTLQAAAEDSVPPQEFVGSILGSVAFCGFGTRVDQFKLGQQMKALQLTSADRPQIEKFRDQYYAELRANITDAVEHEKYCRVIQENRLIAIVLRKFSEPDRTSDTSQQQEKITSYGDMLGAMAFCGVDVDGEKLGRKLFSIGLTSESMSAVQARSKVRRSILELERGQMKGSLTTCSELQSNAFVKQVKKTP
jgi:uncharacterized protein YnzC (UPF0291/DUF896 family)